MTTTPWRAVSVGAIIIDPDSGDIATVTGQTLEPTVKRVRWIGGSIGTLAMHGDTPVRVKAHADWLA